MTEFMDSFSIKNAQFETGKNGEMFIFFMAISLIDNRERKMVFSFQLYYNSIGNLCLGDVYTIGENDISIVSEEEFQFRLNMKTYRNALFRRLKEENAIRLHVLFL